MSKEGYINKSLSKSKSKSPTITRKNTGNLTERKQSKTKKKNHSPSKKSKLFIQLFTTPLKSNSQVHLQKLKYPHKLIFQEDNDDSQVFLRQTDLQTEKKQ